jgi:HAMP domain-containing protein
VAWIGALLLLRALIGLTLWERPFRRRTWIAAAGFALVLFLSRNPGTGVPAIALLAIPWLWSLRWSVALGGGHLALLSVGTLLSVALATISYGPGAGDWPRSGLSGIASLHLVASVLAGYYAIIALPRLAWRVQFSIRRIAWRLVASHLLAGLVPGILSTLFLLLAGAFYLSTYRGMVAERALRGLSQNAEQLLARGFVSGGDPPAAPFGEETPGQVIVLRDGGASVRVLGGGLSCDPDSLLAQRQTTRDAPLLWDGQRLFLRARVDTLQGGRRLVAEALAPVDSLRMVALSRVLGVPVRLNPHARVVRTATSMQIGGDEDSTGVTIGPRRPGGTHIPGGALIPCLISKSDGWSMQVVPVVSSASPGEMLASLFSSARENPLATVVLGVLGILAFLILGAIWITIGMVAGMGRSIAKTVRALTDATRALREGRLEHRIPIEGQDELWSVAGSFNEMADGLERMRVVELERERLEQELKLARDIQTRLLPPGPPEILGLDLAGLSRPARHVGGDYFDYLALDGGAIAIVIADVSGKGVPAALLMSSFRASLRSEDIGALGPARVLTHLNRFICASVDPGKFITAFLAIIEPATGRVRYACAGHDPPILMGRDGTVRELAEGGLVLGLFPDTAYEEAVVDLPVGATLALYTDGVTEAQNPAEEFFGRERLVETLLGARAESCSGILERIVDDIERFADKAPQYDDITLVLARRP